MMSIDSLRRHYRNKTQHPQLTYTSDESQDILGTCIKMVNDIVSDLKARKIDIEDDLPF